MNANFTKTISKAKQTISKHSPEILTGVAVVGAVTTTAFTIKGTVKAVRLVDAKKEELGVDRLEPIDLIKTAAPCYIPTALGLALTIGCGVASTKVSIKRTAAYTALYEGARIALDETKKSIVDVVGEKKAAEIENKRIENKMAGNPNNEGNTIIMKESASPVYDVRHDRYFTSSWQELDDARRRVKDAIITNPFDTISMADIYYEFGLKGGPGDEYVGYNRSMFTDVGVDNFIKIEAYTMPNHEPGFALIFMTEPVNKFDSKY